VSAVYACQRASYSARMTDPIGIYNWLRLDERLTTSGQPAEAELADIRTLGVDHVVNLGLHTHEKALPDEAASVTALGMTYVHMPVDFKNPTAADLSAFCDLMDALRDRTIHVHCIANYRVSAFLYRYRVDRLGWDPQAARPDLNAVWTPEGPWADVVEA
jgi:protein tyrosine phosphatase (PTP) superfamily phosphohydrolase (DUF442 family)